MMTTAVKIASIVVFLTASGFLYVVIGHGLLTAKLYRPPSGPPPGQLREMRRKYGLRPRAYVLIALVGAALGYGLVVLAQHG